MRNKIQKPLAVLALLLGIAHLGFGFAAYKTFNLELLWFLSGGIAMIVTALANLDTGKVGILRVQNALTLGFVVALAYLAPQPQVLLGLALFAGLFGISCLKPKD